MDERHHRVIAPGFVGEDDLPYLLRTASQRLSRLLESRLGGAPGRPGTDLESIHLLSRAMTPLGVPSGVLAEHLGVRKQSISRRIAALEAAGLLECERHPLDGRVTLVCTSDDGHELVVRYRAAVREVANLLGDHLDLDAADHGLGLRGREVDPGHLGLDSVQRLAVTTRTLAVVANTCA